MKSITDYGASPGLADVNLGAIQKALDEAVSNPAEFDGVVMVPPGTWLVSGGLNLPEGVKLLGCGRGISVLQLEAGAYTSDVTLVSGTICVLQDLTLDGNAAAALPADDEVLNTLALSSCSAVLRGVSVLAADGDTFLVDGVAAAVPAGSLESVIFVSDGEETPATLEVTSDNSSYASYMTTAGLEDEATYNLGDGTGVAVGTLRLLVCNALTHASDTIVLDDANFAMTGEVITAITFDAAGEFLLVEFNGAAWLVLYATTGVVAIV